MICSTRFKLKRTYVLRVNISNFKSFLLTCVVKRGSRSRLTTNYHHLNQFCNLILKMATGYTKRSSMIDTTDEDSPIKKNSSNLRNVSGVEMFDDSLPSSPSSTPKDFNPTSRKGASHNRYQDSSDSSESDDESIALTRKKQHGNKRTPQSSYRDYSSSSKTSSKVNQIDSKFKKQFFFMHVSQGY